MKSMISPPWSRAGAKIALVAAGFCLLAAGNTPPRPAPPAYHAPRVTRQVRGLGEWRLEIVRDLFSGDIECRLHSARNDASYLAGAVSFRVGTPVGPAQAIYRIDDGAIHRARDDLPALIARGAPVDRGPPGNASLGQVWVPYEDLAGADRITFELRRDTSLRGYRFHGLAGLHDFAVTQGCTDSRFVP